MKQVFKIDSNGYYLEPVIISDGGSVPSNCVSVAPPNGLYKAQFTNGTWVEARPQADILADLKAMKKADLSQQCNIAIMSGFKSSALGVEHTYPSDMEAQLNFNSTMNRFLTDSNFTTISFKTLDAGYLDHTKDQFFKVFADGHDYGDQQIQHLNDLKSKVDVAQTKADLDAIVW